MVLNKIWRHKQPEIYTHLRAILEKAKLLSLDQTSSSNVPVNRRWGPVAGFFFFFFYKPGDEDGSDC